MVLVALQHNRRICARIKVRREIMPFSPSENRQCGLWSTVQGEDKHGQAFLVFGEPFFGQFLELEVAMIHSYCMICEQSVQEKYNTRTYFISY